ncbi:MAG TPA: ABC transporter substrate-binding protein [Solirubrobacteraceae bacterium]|nr:ABC transporter substrate-binding protein [Solirubrobacteraceae bacterium]
MSTDSRRLDAVREGRSELENHYIDELVAGRLGRREFLRRGAALGMSAGVMGAVLAACGGANKTGTAAHSSTSTSSSAAATARGGTMRLASQVPSGAVNPLTVSDAGGLCMLAMTGEFLTYDNNQALRLQPMLATSWKPSAGGSVWTFQIRPGVRFHDGSPLTADDVVWTMQQLSDKKNASNALSTFGGVLTPDGVRKVDTHAVAFHLEAPNGNFPYLVSSDNYNAIIVPKGTDFAKWQKTFVGTGPFTLGAYTQNQGATFHANPHYWGGKPNLDTAQFSFYQSQAPQITALQSGNVDVIVQFVAQGAQAITNGANYDIIKLKSSNHRELSMRCDRAPFNDPRVREAVALSLDRPAMVKALLQGLGQIGNDSPFAPKFPSTDTSVPQRTMDVAKARQLLSAAGHSHISTTLYTEQYQEIPALAQVIQQSAAKIGVDIKLRVETQSAYYGKATFGNSDWLDGTMSLVDYGDRGVPNVFLEAPLTSGGSWNAAHFRDPTYDALVKQYVAAVDLSSQRAIAGKIERLLLAQTPLVIPYFIDGLCATTKKVSGVEPTSISQVFLGKASISA